MFSEMDEAEDEAEVSAAAQGEESLGGGEQQLQPSAVLTLDGLAAAVRQQHPLLFGNRSSGVPQQDPQQQQAQVQALCDVVYRQLRFKHEPFEWVYEGLEPLLLPPLLRRRKLTPLTLAVVAAATARRLGLPLLPLPAHSAEAVASAAAAVAAAAHLDGAAAAAAAASSADDASVQLRPDLAQRYAAKAQIAAPTAEPWVLILPTAAAVGAMGHGSSSSSPQQPQGSLGARGAHLLIDAGTGKPLDGAAAQLQHPSLSQVLGVEWTGTRGRV